MVFSIPEADHLNVRLRQEIGALRLSSPGLQISNQHGWHSCLDVFDHPTPACQDLVELIHGAVHQASHAVAPGFEPNGCGLQWEGWININGRGAYNTPHDHPGWAWSGVYYVQVPSDQTNRGGCLELLDSRTNTRVVPVPGAACLQGKFTYRPVAGTLVIFPSFVRHWVYPNEQDEERISVAFNARYVQSAAAGSAVVQQAGRAA